VSIIQALYALVFGVRASRSRGTTIIISFTSIREDASGIFTAFSSTSFTVSPVGQRTVCAIEAFYAATSIKVAVGSTVIRAVLIGSTESYANVGLRIAVGLTGDFSSINTRSTFLTRRLGSTRIATTISATVRGGDRAISILSARSAGTIGQTGRLLRNMTSIEDTTVSSAGTGLAASVSLTVGLASSCFTTIVIVTIGITEVRINTNTRSTNGVGSHWERTIVVYTIRVR